MNEGIEALVRKQVKHLIFWSEVRQCTLSSHFLKFTRRFITVVDLKNVFTITVHCVEKSSFCAIVTRSLLSAHLIARFDTEVSKVVTR